MRFKYTTIGFNITFVICLIFLGKTSFNLPQGDEQYFFTWVTGYPTPIDTWLIAIMVYSIPLLVGLIMDYRKYKQNKIVPR